MPIALIAAGIGAAGSIAGAAISSNAASNASDKAAQAAAANNALQREIYASNKGELQPYIDRGNTAGGAESALLGLGGDAGAAKNAFDKYLGSTGYQFQLGQGVNAITGNRAASGTLDSGGTLKSLNAYGQGIASNYFQSYLNNLSGVAGTGLTGASALAGVGQNYANAVSQNNNNAANTAANAGLSSANSINGLIASGLNAFGSQQGLSSFMRPNSGGFTSPTVAQYAAGGGNTSNLPPF